MNAREAAAALDGGTYRNEGSRELFAAMKKAGLVAVFGDSDDLMAFRGAVLGEAPAWTGATAYFTPEGLLTNRCGEESCPYFRELQRGALAVTARWSPAGFTWRYRTAIPHETFTILDEGRPYCKGIVFALSDIRPR